MNIINIISDHFLIFIFVLIIFSGVLINLLTSILRKGGEVTVDTGFKLGSKLINLILKILIFFKDCFMVLFLLLSLFIAYFTRKR